MRARCFRATQTCTEFGYYQTCEAGTNCIFSYLITLESNFDICWTVFGISGPENVARIDVRTYAVVPFGGCGVCVCVCVCVCVLVT